MLRVVLILDNWIASTLSPEMFVKEYYLTDRAKKDLKYYNVDQGDDFLEIKKQKNLIRWLQFKSNGKFHLMPQSFAPTQHREYLSKRRYKTVCGLNIIAYPDRVAARDKIYKNALDEYCPKCLEKSNEKKETSCQVK